MMICFKQRLVLMALSICSLQLLASESQASSFVQVGPAPGETIDANRHNIRVSASYGNLSQAEPDLFERTAGLGLPTARQEIENLLVVGRSSARGLSGPVSELETYRQALRMLANRIDTQRQDFRIGVDTYTNKNADLESRITRLQQGTFGAYCSRLKRFFCCFK